MTAEPVVELAHVDKVYKRGSERMNLRAALPGRAGRTTFDDGHWAMHDVSLAVDAGEIVGVVGPNGAGKSTLLKLVARVIAPTRGRVRTQGRVASLIELGVGFHPDLSGADNVRFSAAILGMSRTEIAKRYDEIVAFAGIEPFMTMPVKRYSSGMLARLGFAVASHLEAEVVLVDEVLSVGDADFQRRGFQRMQTLRSRGATLLFVTHNLWLVPEVCQRAIRIEQGRIVDEGDPALVVERYQSRNTMDMDLQRGAEAPAVRLRSFQLSRATIGPNDEFDVTLRFSVLRPLARSRITFVVTTPGGTHAAGTDMIGTSDALETTGDWRVDGRIQGVRLASGHYRVYATVVEEGEDVVLTHTQAAAGLFVEAANDAAPQYGTAIIDGVWSVQATDETAAESGWSA